MDDVELTEFEAIDVKSIKGVAQGANGFPILMMKGLAPVAKGSRDCEGCGKSYDADAKADNCEDCGKKLPDADASKAADDDGKCKTCGGTGKIMGGNRDCPDCDGPAEKSIPPWHAAAATLARMALAAPSLPRESLFKAVAADGSVDEQPDIDGGKQAIALIAKLIGYEADELAAGCLDETWDIQLLCEAAGALKCWLRGEQASGDGTDSMLMASAAKADLSTSSINDLPDSAFAHIEPGGSKDEDGKTTPRSKRHFPVHDEAHAKNALARLSSSPFGDKAKVKVHAAAKKFGIEVSDTSKSTVAEGEKPVDTEAQGTGGLSKAVEDAVTKAMAPLQERITVLDAELAKVKATPVPGGPALSHNVQVKNQRAERQEDWAAKSAYYREMAETVTDRPTADGYRKLAREADEKAMTAPAAT
jgi:hypothetical protein